MQVFVGTSGWFYEWNKDKNLDWFVKNSDLNAVELNASFYRFPFKNMVKSWARKGINLRWSIKVNRLITHQHKFDEKAIEVWNRFRDLFQPLDKLISFYLFQAMPSFTDTDRVLEFASKVKLGNRFAFEIRNKELLKDEKLCRKLQKRVVLVSVDSPDFQNKIFPGKVIYLRMHGRTDWYLHDYSEKELKEIADKITELKPKKVYVFFNNDHNMLENARLMFKLFN
ncbi:MAG: DUF72 domain-containing protein [Candidatus Aenigmarchaeota archaeon]|nr:DUF72 domain-containing protein [Candidatus Aenigmarchaeota archaeon]